MLALRTYCPWTRCFQLTCAGTRGGPGGSTAPPAPPRQPAFPSDVLEHARGRLTQACVCASPQGRLAPQDMPIKLACALYVSASASEARSAKLVRMQQSSRLQALRLPSAVPTRHMQDEQQGTGTCIKNGARQPNAGAIRPPRM